MLIDIFVFLPVALRKAFGEILSFVT